MSFDFDHIIDRKPTHSFKWDKYQGQDVIPMWVADAEFKPPQAVIDAIKERTEHGILGYTLPYDELNQSVVDWVAKQHNWHILPDWIVWTPGVVPAFNVACKAYCEPGDKVLIQVPNYPPLLKAPSLNQCERVDIPSVLIDGRWQLDLVELEKQAADPKCKLFIMCNPMNPCGSVMTEQELKQVAEICLRHNVLLCSDEIHCDLILEEGVKHIPAPALPEIEGRAISLMAPSKTFNIAGLGASFAIIPDSRVRMQFRNAALGIVPWVQVLGLVATEAAFNHGHDWHKALIEYLRQNRDYLYQEINSLKGMKLTKADATFLAWIDCSELGVEDVQSFFENAGVGPSPGRDFGEPEYARINFACSRTQLIEAVERIKKAHAQLSL
ncbi:pyridoxal phosphate-dependent aminotransferase [Catenovulum sp. 2E275]|uniref:MalY/PatB family protein n=1 Tax=Catenovulum sp. 2E275 TaxID=2980497 RepID=UPI0021D3C8F5|nr:MalY/PatB family protein [Catenovulum sp. 2E275]MCU4675015.1 pyridoxal phosphate-dependent aminotransferase [Catenovulum sp. 2E275]